MGPFAFSGYTSRGMGGLIEQFRERRIWRVLIAWPSVAFVLLQAIEFFINNYDFDTRFLTAGMIVAIGLFPAGIVWNWRHGEVGRQQFSGAELSSYAVFAVATLIAAIWYWQATPATVQPNVRHTVAARSVVVLPFENASGDEELRYLSDGIAENLINWLSGIPGLRVVSKTASFRFAETPFQDGALRQEFGVDSAIRGKLDVHGDNIVISASFTNLHDDSQIWGERLIRPLDEVIYLERSIVAAMKDSLQLRISGESETSAASGSTDNPEAYRRYLRGHHLIQATDVESIDRGLDELREAIRLDPQFGQPYADFADALSQMIFYGIYDDPALMGEARNAAYSAVALAPNLPEAHTALATMLQYLSRDWTAVEEAYEASIALTPQSPAPFHRYADFLWATLRFERARNMAQRAIEIDPLDGSSMHAVGIIELLSGNFEAAADALGEWNRFHPSSGWSYIKHAVALSLAGRCDESAEQIATVEQMTAAGRSILAESWFAWAHQACGRHELYVQSRDRILARHAQNPDQPDPGMLYLYLVGGESDKVIDLSREMADAHHPVTLFLQLMALDYMGWPVADEVGQDERFKELMRELDFPTPD